MSFNIPTTQQKRVVIVGAGFGGLTLARQLANNSHFQIVLIDKNNYHQFQPLFYQVAMAGLEPSSIVFPLRKMFQRKTNVFVRVTQVDRVDPVAKTIETGIGTLSYDYLALAMGVDTNWYGNEKIKANAIPMKSVSEALYLRNLIFDDYEKAVAAPDDATRQSWLDIAVVGGGPTGVEVAGSLAEMRSHIVPKDYHDLDPKKIDIHLIHGMPKLLNTMSAQSSEAAEVFLRKMGVNLWLDEIVTDYDGQTVTTKSGKTIRAKKVIWAAGIVGNSIQGLPEGVVTRGNRLNVNEFNQLESHPDIFVIGDLAFQTHETAYPSGHPQVAQVAIQQANNVAKNLIKGRNKSGSAPLPFRYRDLGSMATIGRHKAVADLPFAKIQGAFAWFAWLFVHLFALLGAKNKLFVFLNWVWNYFTYDQSLRLVIKPWKR